MTQEPTERASDYRRVLEAVAEQQKVIGELNEKDDPVDPRTRADVSDLPH